MVEEKVVFHIHQDSHACPKRLNAAGKSVQYEQAAQPPKQPSCPKCGSGNSFKDGWRQTRRGPVQRFLCRACGYRFSQEEPPQEKLNWCINRASPTFSSSQVCDILIEESKNLAENARCERPSVGGTNETIADIRGKVVQYAFWMEKQGYSKETVRGNLGCLRALQNRNGDLLDPESIKTALAKEQKWSPNRRRNIINAYSLFLKVNCLKWEKPKCRVERRFPFIPTEAEIDSLISGCGFKTSTFLLLLKETAMRSGEAKRLEWVSIDTERNRITLNDPEKGSNPRIWKVSPELIGMLNMMPKKGTRIFGDGPINSLKTTFTKARKRLAAKLQNPRLLNISFHTFRHWKATMLYHKTKDPYYVKDFLGHKCLSNTEIYINIERTLFEDQSDEFTVKVAEKQDDIKTLLEAGSEYVCQKDNFVYLRKRK